MRTAWIVLPMVIRSVIVFGLLARGIHREANEHYESEIQRRKYEDSI